MPVTHLARLLVDERGEIGLVYLYAAAAGLLSLALPLGVQAIIGLVSGGMLLQPVVILVSAVVAGTAAAGVLQLLQLAAVERMQQRIFARLALDWGARLGRIDIERLGNASLPEAVNRFFEVVIIQKGLAKLLTEAVAAILTVVLGLLLLAVYHASLAVSGVVFLVLLVLALWFTGRQALPTSFAESSAKYRLAHWLQEIARRLVLFRVTPSALPLIRTDQEVASYLRSRQDHFRVIVRQSVVTVVFRTLITGVLLVLGTMLVVDRQITLGQFVAAELVVVGILAAVDKLVASLSTAYDVLTSAEKAAHVSELPAIEDAGTGIFTPSSRAGIEVRLDSLSYVYPGSVRPVLRDVNMDIAPGSHVAIIGIEGSGESSLLRLMAGLLPSYSGNLRYDGASARDLELDALQRHIGFVEQSPRLFDGTLEENIALARPWVRAEDVQWALEFAGLTSFVGALPNGLRTRVGDGTPLPMHLARKVALARAVAGRPGLLLFDEFFHHLDPIFKRELIARLLRRDAGWTIVAASHDSVFLASCDHIYVLEHGEVVREGVFETLLADPAFAGVMRAQQDGPLLTSGR